MQKRVKFPKFTLKFAIFKLLLNTDSILNKHTAVNFWAFIALGGWKNIFRIQTFYFFFNFVTLSVSHQDKSFRLKNSQKLLFFGQNRGKQTKSKKFLENRQTWCWSITYFSSPDIRPIGKKLDHFKVKSQRGGRSSNRRPLKTSPPFSLKSCMS